MIDPDPAPDIDPARYHRIGCEHDRPYCLRHRMTEGIYA